MSKVNRVKELVETLNYHRNLYYNESRPEISDFEYDQLFDELSKLEKETGIVMSTSPTVTVGYEVKSSLSKVKHNHPMLSLDKTKNVDDVIKFLDGRNGIVMAKMDGLTCSLQYLDGKLVSAETRGNGEVGEDILHCARVIKNIPLTIECLDEVVIDGEVIITYDDFEKINAILSEDQKYKHPRNLASGSIRQLDSRIAAQRNMKFIAWKMVKGYKNNSFYSRLIRMANWGFDIIPVAPIPTIMQNKQQVTEAIDTMKDWANQKSFPIDGCVFGFDDIAYGESLGATGHHLRSQLAFKFYDEVYDTKLLYIDWTMGKTNSLNPTAVFEPVDIDGTEVSRASLHNLSIIKSLGLTNNCTVRVYKANQIIPQIDSCENDGNGEIEIPSTCPICGGDTAIQKDNDSEVLICTNPNCSGKLLGEFVHFCSKKCMNIDGLSVATLKLLIDNKYLFGIPDIYYLYHWRDQLIKLPGLGAKSVDKLLDSIERSKNIKLENFIAAFGIPNIGLSAAKTISQYCHGNWEEFYDLIFDTRDWTFLNDFGQVMSDSLNEYLENNFNLIEDIGEEMHFITPEQNNDTSLDGLKFCITGSFSRPRDDLKKELESRGAKFVSSVSKNLDVLFAGEKAGSKLTKAQSLGVKVVDEAELLQMIRE